MSFMVLMLSDGQSGAWFSECYRRRKILDASLIANEAIDFLLKRNANG